MVDKTEIMLKTLVIFLFFTIEGVSLCQPKLFGTGCRFRCHCKDDEQCDVVTGQCPSECDHSWAGPSCQYRNIALDYVFTEHSDKSTDSRLAIDGAKSSCTKVVRAISKPWWRIWLSNEYTITELEIVIEKSYEDYFKNFKVTVEHVPKELATQTLDEYIFPKVAVCYHNTARISSTTINVVCDRPLKGNQVRIQLVGEAAAKLSICDVRILQGRNIAFGRRTSASSYLNGTKSLAAVDGITTSKSNCSMTNKQTKPWWSIDLAHVIVINRINITAHGGYERELRGFKISVSNDSLHWVQEHRDTSTSTPLTNISVELTARFVNLTLDGTKTLVLCEVQILGDCLPNVCGFDCADPCYCKTFSSKIKMSGECPNGCLDNWTGENKTCNTVASYIAPAGVTLSDVAFSFTILGSIVFASVTSVCITIFVMKKRQTSSSSSDHVSSSRCDEGHSRIRTHSGQFSRLKMRMLSLYYNTSLKPKNGKRGSKEGTEYDDLELPPRTHQRKEFEGYADLENKMKKLGKVKV